MLLVSVHSFIVAPICTHAAAIIPEFCVVGGEVTSDGNPMGNMVVVFERKGERSGFFCVTGRDGKYEAKIRPGTFSVSVASRKKSMRVKYQGSEGGENHIEIHGPRRIDFRLLAY